jgi:hypothetical protein
MEISESNRLRMDRVSSEQFINPAVDGLLLLLLIIPSIDLAPLLLPKVEFLEFFSPFPELFDLEDALLYVLIEVWNSNIRCRAEYAGRIPSRFSMSRQSSIGL